MKFLFLFIIPFSLYQNHREVYIFYNQNGIALKEKQLAELTKDKPGWQERDLILHLINSDSATRETVSWNINTTRPFTFLLVGKDGGEKLRSEHFISNKQLFTIIDAMPMRREEIRGKP